MENAKPDYIDIDKDGDKEEPMKDAAKEGKAQNFAGKKVREQISKNRKKG